MPRSLIQQASALSGASRFLDCGAQQRVERQRWGPRETYMSRVASDLEHPLQVAVTGSDGWYFQLFGPQPGAHRV